MILVALGSNLPAAGRSDPRDSCEAALAMLSERGVAVARRSRWWRTAPVPISDQPWFCNGVARVESALGPAELMALLHGIEDALGRVRVVRNEARVIDLDLLAHGDTVLRGAEGPVLPHPRLHERAFVLLPLAEVAPGWRHPVLGLTVEQMLAALPAGQAAEPMAEGPG